MTVRDAESVRDTSAMTVAEKAGRWEQFSWMMYDFANTSFTVMIVTFVYAVYFKGVVCAGMEGNKGDFLWGLNGTISMLIVALLSPVLGAIADHSRSKKKFLTVFALICIVFCALLSVVKTGMVFWGMVLFIIANIGFQGGNVFYNAFLPELTTRENFGKISGYGWALGYLGAVVIILICRPFLMHGFAPENLGSVRLTFLLSAVFYLVFSLPIFFWLKERAVEELAGPDVSYFRAGFRRLRVTFQHIREFRELVKFLAAYFLYIEGVTTVIYFSTIYAQDTLQFTMPELIKFYILVQTTGILGALVFGWICDRILPKKTISLTLVIWLVVIVGASMIETKSAFWVIGMLAGLAMGSSQSVSRSMMGLLTPDNKRAEFFGFYGISGKFSAAIGPLVFGVMSWVTGSQRQAILAVGAFFLLGLVLLQWVREQEGIAVGRVLA